MGLPARGGEVGEPAKPRRDGCRARREDEPGSESPRMRLQSESTISRSGKMGEASSQSAATGGRAEWPHPAARAVLGGRFYPLVLAALGIRAVQNIRVSFFHMSI
jgi:hypothetical protein